MTIREADAGAVAVLRTTFERGAVSRGAAYAGAGRVTDVHMLDGGKKVVAHVAGSAGNVYRTTLVLQLAKEGAYFDGRCNCPVAYDCKHAAAAAIEAYAGYDILATARDVSAAHARARHEAAGPSAEVQRWLRRLEVEPEPADEDGEKLITLRWIVTAADGNAGFPSIAAATVSPVRDGTFGKPKDLPIIGLITNRSPYVGAIDRSIARSLEELSYAYNIGARQMQAVIDDVMLRLVATGNLCFEDARSAPLVLGPSRPGRFEWRTGTNGKQRLVLGGDNPNDVVLPWLRPWYIDQSASLIGRLDVAMTPEDLALAYAAPAVTAAEAPHVDRVIGARARPINIPRATEPVREEMLTVSPSAQLTVYRNERDETVAGLAMLYDNVCAAPNPAGGNIRAQKNGARVVYHRDADGERALIARLAATQVTPLPTVAHGELLFAVMPSYLARFLHFDLDGLRVEGWRIDVHPSVGMELVDATVSWTANLKEQTNRLFHCDLGVDIDGERIPLAPVLLQLFSQLPADNIDGALDDLAVDGRLYATLKDGRAVVLPVERAQAILAMLIEMFHGNATEDMQLTLPQALALTSVDPERVRVENAKVQHFAQALRAGANVAHVPAPAGLHAELRPYQHEGLNWLQFLREHGLGGILADDMGLGKTVQTLAHILCEKEAGRLDRPVLVIAPTSVIPNWASEAERFAPSLRVLVLHGPQRHDEFARIDAHDVVITSYPLLVRDAALLAVSWYLVVLDEAQTIKNAQAKVAVTVRQLSATHRLCLSGTPLENHIGELWSLFEFLMPGVLGDPRTFNRNFRIPIEKGKDRSRQIVLAARVRPFILRRTKDVVAAELPEKTEVIRRIELHRDQRDLYETVRATMDKKVREQIKQRGLAQSRIIVLDALLKLRQVCCDARLLKMPTARKITRSAKLEALLAMLDEMLEEGRRILIFSQFTSMLALIEQALTERSVAYALLTGDTVDRRTPVKEFQAGKVSVFLISLKAGGTGLNLTAADTVIHYDPWWNPAVERQATDRAHRIGQRKPVFVYKLVIQGSVEERILEIQERKGMLADTIFDPENVSKASFDDADIDALFGPLAG